jgi:signal transduction histidine kinase
VLLIILIGCGAVMVLLLERTVLIRLSQLTAGVMQIGSHPEQPERVAIEGHDELAHLAEEINGMLNALEHAEAERRKAEQANIRAKSEFLSAVSHEIRTPLTPIQGYVDLMMIGAGGELSNDQREFLGIIKLNTTRMTMLIDDLLEIGRLDAGRLSLSYDQIDIGAMAEEVCQLLLPEIQRKDMQVNFEIAEDLPLIVADNKRINQVLTNLVSNAIKYTRSHGTIWIRAARVGNAQIEVQVEDTGVGLMPEQLEKLFTRFYRANNALSNQVHGTGLGLAIAKSFIDAHGGTINVQSTHEVGSLFTFRIPIRPPFLETDASA